MPSRLDLMREGKTVETKDGLKARLNKERKTLELSNGKIIDVSDDTDYFPKNENELQVSRKKEALSKKYKGPIGEFVYQYTNQGIPGSISDWKSYATQTGEEYANTKTAEREVGERISEESPFISGAATVANIGTDLALTRGMSGLKAAPLLTAASSGSRLITDTQEVAKDTAISALVGAGGDWVTDKLGKVANRRGEIRNLPAQQEAVRAQNVAGQEANDLFNTQNKQAFSNLKQTVNNVNESRTQTFEKQLEARKNKIIQDQNDFKNEKFKVDQEVNRLQNEARIKKAQHSADASKAESEYKMALEDAKRQEKLSDEKFKMEMKQYEQDLKNLPEMQKKAQKEYSENVVRNSAEIEKSFPRDSKISSDQLGVNNFIDESINKTGLAGSREASQASRILRSLFPEGEYIAGRELSKRYKGLEDAIQRSSPEVQQVLNNFKSHLGEKLTSILEDTLAYNKIYPKIIKNVKNDIKSVLNEINFNNRPSLKKRIENIVSTNAENLMKYEDVPTNFLNKLHSKELADDIVNKIISIEDFVLINDTEKAILGGKKLPEGYFSQGQSEYNYFTNQLRERLIQDFSKYEIIEGELAKKSAKNFGRNIKKTYGLSEPVNPPVPPNSPSPVPYPTPQPIPPPPAPPSFPPPPSPPLTPPSLSKPSMLSQPTLPPAQSFNPLPEPNLPPPNGLSERMGDVLENNKVLGGNNLVNNPLTKLAGLKFLLGKAALPAEAAYGGLKGLTSPTQAGAVARETFRQGGIEAVNQWAQQYPSYNNGILNDPRDRRSLTKQIEDDFEIPLEQKALMQSKVNRGIPLQANL